MAMRASGAPLLKRSGARTPKNARKAGIFMEGDVLLMYGDSSSVKARSELCRRLVNSRLPETFVRFYVNT